MDVMLQYTSTICYLNSYTPNLIVLVLLPTMTTKSLWCFIQYEGNIRKMFSCQYLCHMRSGWKKWDHSHVDWQRKTTEWHTNKTRCTTKRHITDLEHIKGDWIVVIYGKKIFCIYYSLLFTNYDFIVLL